jgi:hypothetical protein
MMVSCDGAMMYLLGLVGELLAGNLEDRGNDSVVLVDDVSQVILSDLR